MAINLSNRLSVALGLLSEDSPVEFKHDGLKKKTAVGAHRFDPPTEYVQMQHDNKWGTKSDQKKLS